jgi:[ribosomal protein S18]-alanine N-acetyltransferase
MNAAMKTATLRDCEGSDFSGIFSLWAAVGMLSPERGDNAETIRKTIAHGGRLLVYKESHQVIGSVWITNDTRRLYLHHLAVHPDWQKQGLGRRLFNEALAIAKDLGMQLKLEVHQDNVPARKLYDSSMTVLEGYVVYQRRI